MSDPRAEEAVELAGFLEREGAALAGVCLGIGAEDQVSAKYERAAALLRLLSATADEPGACSTCGQWCVACTKAGVYLPEGSRLRATAAVADGTRIEGFATEGGYDFEFTTRTAACPPWKPATLILKGAAVAGQDDRTEGGV